MKKLIPFFVFGTIASANAQVVIEESDFPVAGDTITYGDDGDVSNLTLDMGANGSGQTFDFSNLETDELFDVGFYDPQDVTGGADFPTAVLAVDQIEGIYGFASISSGSVDIIGLGGDFAEGFGLNGQFVLSLPADDPWTIFEFPASVDSDALIDTAYFQGKFESSVLPQEVADFLPQGTDSVQVKRAIYFQSEIVGDGQLTDPLGTTHQVVKMEVVEANEDSIFTRTNGVWQPVDPFLASLAGIELSSTVYRTRFISKGLGYYVVDVTTESNGTPVSATFVSNESQCCAGVEDIIAAGQNVIYPNPTNDFVRVRTGGDIYEFNIYDMTGKLHVSELLTMDNQAVNLEGLSTGLYIFQMVDEAGKVAHTSRLSVVK